MTPSPPAALLHASRLLERTPAVLAALLGGLPDAWLEQREAPGTWSPLEVVGHLIHGEETDWIPRARILLEHGEARAFEPFDRSAHLGAFDELAPDALLERFAVARRESLAALAELRLTPASLALCGTHPALGRVTLGELLATWVAHDLDHLGQITRVLASAQREAVGPWRAYLRILG